MTPLWVLVVIVLWQVQVQVEGAYDYQIWTKGSDVECTEVGALMTKNVFASFTGTQEHRLIFSRDLWTRFFKKYPGAKKYLQKFNADNLYSPEWNAHMMRILGGILNWVGVLDEEPLHRSIAAHFTENHKRLKIPDEYLTGWWDTWFETHLDYSPACVDWDMYMACAKKAIDTTNTGISL